LYNNKAINKTNRIMTHQEAKQFISTVNIGTEFVLGKNFTAKVVEITENSFKCKDYYKGRPAGESILPFENLTNTHLRQVVIK